MFGEKAPLPAIIFNSCVCMGRPSFSIIKNGYSGLIQFFDLAAPRFHREILRFISLNGSVKFFIIFYCLLSKRSDQKFSEHIILQHTNYIYIHNPTVINSDYIRIVHEIKADIDDKLHRDEEVHAIGCTLTAIIEDIEAS